MKHKSTWKKTKRQKLLLQQNYYLIFHYINWASLHHKNHINSSRHAPCKYNAQIEKNSISQMKKNSKCYITKQKLNWKEMYDFCAHGLDQTNRHVGRKLIYFHHIEWMFHIWQGIYLLICSALVMPNNRMSTSSIVYSIGQFFALHIFSICFSPTRSSMGIWHGSVKRWI